MEPETIEETCEKLESFEDQSFPNIDSQPNRMNQISENVHEDQDPIQRLRKNEMLTENSTTYDGNKHGYEDDGQMNSDRAVQACLNNASIHWNASREKEELIKQYKDIERAIDCQRDHVKDKNTIIERLKRQIKEQETTLAISSLDNEKLFKQLQDEKTKQKQLKNELECLRNQAEDLEELVKKKTQETKNFSLKLANQEEDWEKAKLQLVTENKNLIEKNEAEFLNLTKQLKESNNKVTHLTAELEEKKQMIGEGTVALEAACNKIKDLRDQVQSGEEETRCLEERLDEEVKRVQSLEREVAKRDTLMTSAGVQIQEAADRLMKAENEMKEKTSLAEKLNVEKNEIIKLNEGLKTDLAVAQQSKLDLEKVLQSKNEHIYTLQSQINKLSNQVENLKFRMDSKDEQLAIKDNDLKKVSREKQTLQEQMTSFRDFVLDLIKSLGMDEILFDGNVPETSKEMEDVFSKLLHGAKIKSDSEKKLINKLSSEAENRKNVAEKDLDEKKNFQEKIDFLENKLREKETQEFGREEDLSKHVKQVNSLTREVNGKMEELESVKRLNKILQKELKEREENQNAENAENKKQIKELGKTIGGLESELSRINKEVERSASGKALQSEMYEEKIRKLKESSDGLEKRHKRVLELLNEECEKVRELVCDKETLKEEVSQLKEKLGQQKVNRAKAMEETISFPVDLKATDLEKMPLAAICAPPETRSVTDCTANLPEYSGDNRGMLQWERSSEDLLDVYLSHSTPSLRWRVHEEHNKRRELQNRIQKSQDFVAYSRSNVAASSGNARRSGNSWNEYCCCFLCGSDVIFQRDTTYLQKMQILPEFVRQNMT